MPITPLHPVRRMSQSEFKELSYAMMGQVFQIHNDFGRLFDESIYKRELACRFPGVELEFPITVSHGGFSTTYFLDVLIDKGGAFEFKAVEKLTARHQGQFYNYRLMLDLGHGKLVNTRSDNVVHEFVNAPLRSADRYSFESNLDRWDRSLSGAGPVLEITMELLRDWGAGLDLGVYQAAITHILGGEAHVLQDIEVRSQIPSSGRQRMHLAADGIAFRITAFESVKDVFEDHLRRLLRHLDLHALLWINIGVKRVTFTSLERGRL